MRERVAVVTAMVGCGSLVSFLLLYCGYLPRDPVILIAIVSGVILAVAVAIIPLYYPKHSLFTCRANHALDKIRYVSDPPSDIHLSIGWSAIGCDERGFDELFEVIEEQGAKFPPNQTPVEIGHLGESREQLNKYFDSEVALHPTRYEMIYVETEGDRPEGVSPKTPVMRTQIPQAKPNKVAPNVLDEHIADTAQARANFYTAGLAIIWSTVSILLTIYPAVVVPGS